MALNPSRLTGTRWAIWLRVGMIAMTMCSLLVRPAHAAPSAAIARAEALTALLRLRADFLQAGTGLYMVSGGKHEPYAALWPVSQVLAAEIGVARLTHAPADLERVRHDMAILHVYLTPTGAYRARTVPSLRYYDDNNWVALDLLDAYDLLHDPAYLQAAKRVFAFLITGWDTRQGGGIIWADGHGDRPTVATAPAITVGVRLAAITRQALYQTWAKRLYSWENQAMRGPNGLYWDHIQYDGKIDRDFVSYNQGVMIVANLALAQYTGTAQYLRQARAIAAASAAAFPAPRHTSGDSAAFDAIYFEALAALNSQSPGAARLGPLLDFVDWSWPVARAPRVAAMRTEQGLLEQSAFVIAATAAAQALAHQ